MKLSARSAIRGAARSAGTCVLALTLGACNPLGGASDVNEGARRGDQPDWQIVLENRAPKEVLLHVDTPVSSNESRVARCERRSQPFSGQNGEWSIEVDGEEVVDSDRVADLAGDIAPGQPVTVVIDVPPSRFLPYVKSVIVGPFDGSDLRLEGCG